MDFPDDWGSEYVEAARIERHRLRAEPDSQTGRIEDGCWRDDEEGPEEDDDE